MGACGSCARRASSARAHKKTRRQRTKPASSWGAPRRLRWRLGTHSSVHARSQCGGQPAISGVVAAAYLATWVHACRLRCCGLGVTLVVRCGAGAHYARLAACHTTPALCVPAGSAQGHPRQGGQPSPPHDSCLCGCVICDNYSWSLGPHCRLYSFSKWRDLLCRPGGCTGHFALAASYTLSLGGTRGSAAKASGFR